MVAWCAVEHTGTVSLSPWVGRLDLVFAALGQKTRIISVMRALPNFLLSASFRFVELRLGYSVQKALMLVSRLLAAHTEGDTRNHPGTSRSG